MLSLPFKLLAGNVASAWLALANARMAAGRIMPCTVITMRFTAVSHTCSRLTNEYVAIFGYLLGGLATGQAEQVRIILGDINPKTSNNVPDAKRRWPIMPDAWS